jgi:hypothetical protein
VPARNQRRELCRPRAPGFGAWGPGSRTNALTSKLYLSVPPYHRPPYRRTPYPVLRLPSRPPLDPPQPQRRAATGKWMLLRNRGRTVKRRKVPVDSRPTQA